MILGRKHLVFAVAVFSFVSFAAAKSAQATLLIAGTIGATNFCAADNNVGCAFGSVLLDTNPAVGILEIEDQTIGGIAFQGAAQQATFGPTLNILNTSFLQATNTTGATITGSVAVSATGFVPPVVVASVSGSATYQQAVGSSTTLTWYNDPTNQQGAETPADRPGIQLDTFTFNVTQLTDAFGHSLNNIPVNDSGPFSMTLGTNFSLTAGATIVNRGQTEIKPVQAVPEPATLALFGTGLSFLAARHRRRRQGR